MNCTEALMAARTSRGKLGAKPVIWAENAEPIQWNHKRGFFRRHQTSRRGDEIDMNLIFADWETVCIDAKPAERDAKEGEC